MLELCVRLFVDTALWMLIWMTQLIVYPSFTYLKAEAVNRWHPLYTKRISFLVAPLMLFQLFFVSYQLFDSPSYYEVGSFVLVVLTFLVTFFNAVPKHSAVEVDPDQSTEIFKALVAINWQRTIIYTLLLLWTAIELWLKLASSGF